MARKTTQTATIKQRLDNLREHYEGTDTEILGHHVSKEGNDLILVGEKEDGVYFTMMIFKAEKSTGLRHGYVGSQLITMPKNDVSETMFTAMARAALQAL